MPSSQDLEDTFWKALESDRIVMLGLDGAEDGHTRPMAVQIEAHRSPLWFFANEDMALVQKLSGARRAVATFVSKDHELFATLHGSLAVADDRAAVERLWNRHVAAWYEGGKDDPKLVLLRLEADRAEIWQRDSSLFAGVKVLVGGARRREAERNVAEVRLT